MGAPTNATNRQGLSMSARFFSLLLTRRRLLVATSVVTAVAVTAMAGLSPAQSAGAPPNGGDITFLIDSLGSTWIPNNSAISSFQGHIWGHVADKLVYVDADGKVSPWIAESWEQNGEATQFTLHLKKGVTFSDGTPLDASAVVANLDIWHAGRRNEGINPIGLFPKTYDHAEAVDATTVKVVFKAPTLGFIPTLGYHGSILISPKTIAQPAAQQADLAKTSGSGPYVVASWKRATSSSWSSARTTIGGRQPSATPVRPTSTLSPTNS